MIFFMLLLLTLSADKKGSVGHDVIWSKSAENSELLLQIRRQQHIQLEETRCPSFPFSKSLQSFRSF